MGLLFLFCLSIGILIWIILYLNRDYREGAIYAVFIIAAYFVFKFILFSISLIDSQNILEIMESNFTIFLRYLAACLSFALIFIFIYPKIKRLL